MVCLLFIDRQQLLAIVSYKVYHISMLDHLFLRYHGEMRRTAMPKILTMAGLKKLFIEAFNLDRSVTHWPDGVLYIQDRYTDQWSELQDPG